MVFTGCGRKVIPARKKSLDGQIKSNDGFVFRSIQRKQSPAAHYNNKIHVDKTVSSLMFTMKRTAKKISLQLSFESSGGNSSRSEAGRLFQTLGPAV